MRYLLFAPTAQLPIIVALTCLIIGDRVVVGTARKRLVLSLVSAGCWTLCLLWLWGSDFHANIVTGLAIALTVGIQTACLIKTDTPHRGARAMLLNMLVALVLVFAFPIVALILACGSGDCL